MDCLRLFTKEDVLDGDEKPVRGMGLGARGGDFGEQAEPSPRCLRHLLPADLLPLQGQDEVHKEIQHPEVPQDPGAPYPLRRGCCWREVFGVFFVCFFVCFFFWGGSPPP